MTLYCLNPACPDPNNPNTHNYCQGCGQELSKTTQGYLFGDRYIIKQVLGEGNFGRTYLVEDQNFHNRKRVLKKFIANLQGKGLETAKELFKREANILDTLKHEQIPAIYDHFEENNSLYLVEEYIDGDDLVTEFEQQGIFSEDKIKSLLKDLLPVLDYLHQKNLLHRDIKPDNIMRRRYDGKLILIDFGGVKEVSNTRGTLIYTPGYAAIEQMTGNPQPASDIYSLGVTCIRLLTGCFPGDDNENDPIYDSSQATWLWQEYLEKEEIKISDQLSHILNKMLEHLAPNRYHNVKEILENLQESPTYIQPVETSTNLPISEPQKSSAYDLISVIAKPQIFLLVTCFNGSIIIAWLIKYFLYPSSSKPLLLWEKIINYVTLLSVFIILFSFLSYLIFLIKNKNKLPTTIKRTFLASPNHSLKNTQITPTSSNPLKTQKTNSQIPATPSNLSNNHSTIKPTTTISKYNKKIVSSLKDFNFKVIKVNHKGEIIEQENKKSQYFAVELAANIYLEMVVIPKGIFWMGTPEKEGKNSSQERPQHEVSLSSFCMSKYPITQGQWGIILLNLKVKINP